MGTFLRHSVLQSIYTMSPQNVTTLPRCNSDIRESILIILGTSVTEKNIKIDTYTSEL